MRVAGQWEIGEVSESLSATISGDDGRANVATKDLRDFEVDQMRRVQRFVGRKNDATNKRSCRGLEKQLKNCRSVDYNQRLSLSRRTAAAGAG